jgi:hypothetical protein
MRRDLCFNSQDGSLHADSSWIPADQGFVASAPYRLYPRISDTGDARDIHREQFIRCKFEEGNFEEGSSLFFY